MTGGRAAQEKNFWLPLHSLKKREGEPAGGHESSLSTLAAITMRCTSEVPS